MSHQWNAILAQSVPPFDFSNPSGDEGRHVYDREQVETSDGGPMPNARFQLDQDLADLLDEFEQTNHDTDASTLPPRGAMQSAPSLSIILLSAASAVAGFIVALYVSYRELAFTIQASAAIATFFSSVVLGLTGAALSAITNSRAATSNIAFSCGLIVISLLFFGLCLLMGAVAALLLLTIAG